MYRYYFEKLDVFQRSRRLYGLIFKSTKLFPSEEKFASSLQIRRAASSVVANLIEGNSRDTKLDQARFTTMAYSSLMELLGHIILATDQELISKINYEEMRNQIDVISMELISLKKSQLN